MWAVCQAGWNAGAHFCSEAGQSPSAYPSSATVWLWPQQLKLLIGFCRVGGWALAPALSRLWGTEETWPEILVRLLRHTVMSRVGTEKTHVPRRSGVMFGSALALQNPLRTAAVRGEGAGWFLPWMEKPREQALSTV